MVVSNRHFFSRPSTRSSVSDNHYSCRHSFHCCPGWSWLDGVEVSRPRSIRSCSLYPRQQPPRSDLDHRDRRHLHRLGCHGSERVGFTTRSEEHTSELQSLAYLVCRLLLEKKNNVRRR